MEHSDSDLLERWQLEQDADAFAQLVHRYSGMVYSCCRRMLASSAEAEDAAQDCFVALMRNRQPVHSPLGAWLHTVAVRRSVDRIRGSVRRHQREAAFAESLPKDAPPPDPALEELAAHVDEAIAALPEPLRAAVTARFLEQRTHAEIAQASGIAESTVRLRVNKGVDAIRARLKREGIVVTGAMLGTVLHQTAHAAPPTLVSQVTKVAMSGSASTAAAGAGAAVSSWIGLKAAAVVVAGAAVLGFWGYTGLERPATEPLTAASHEVVPLFESTPVAEPPDAQEESVSTAESVGPEPRTGPESPEEAAPYSIRGRIYDAATGVGIPGVVMQVYPDGGGTIVAYSEPSEADGAYRIEPIADGAYSVSLRDRLDGYPEPATQVHRSVVLANGVRLDGIDFALQRGIAISGIVRTAQGEPMEGAEVGVVTPFNPNVTSGHSNRQGRFTLFVPAPTGDAILQARTDDLESLHQDGLTVPDAGLSGIELVLDQPRTGRIRGYVDDGTGQPARDARIRPFRHAPAVFPYGASTEPDANGHFELSGLGPGEYSIIVTPKSAQGFSTADARDRVALAPGQQVDGVQIVFGDEGGYAIAGHVTNAEGQAVSGAELAIYTYTSRMIRTRSKHDGSFLFTGLDDDNYQINVVHFDYSRNAMMFPAGALDAEIVLQPRAVITGRVINAETREPFTSFHAGLLAGSSGQMTEMLLGSGRPFESPDGSFRFERDQSMPVAVVAWAPGFAIAVETLAEEPGGDEHVELRLRPVDPVEGEVVDSAGAPVEGAFVYFVEGVSADRINRASAARTGANGHFTLSSVPGGLSWVAAYKSGHGIGIMHPLRERRIVLPKPATLHGQIEMEGVSTGDITINWHYDGVPHLPYGYTQPGSDYRFRLSDLSPGHLVVSVYGSGEQRYFIDYRVDIVPGRTYEERFEFRPGSGVVEGIVTQNGAPVAGQYIQLERRGTPLTHGFRTRLDANGQYRFENVWSGPLIIRITQYDGGTPVNYEVPITVSPGGVVNQDIELAP